MMNGVSSVGTTNQNYQLAFRAKAGDRKMVHEFIDKSNDLAMDFINKDRSLAEKREVAMRRILSSLRIKDLFVGKKVKPEEATIEHMKKGKRTTEEIVDSLGFEIPKKVMLERLKKENPEAYKVMLMNEAEHKVMLMSNWDILKTIFKEIFKKPSKDEYEKNIEKAVKDGVIDADHAATLLINHALGKK